MVTPGQGSNRRRPNPPGARDSSGPPREARHEGRETDDGETGGPSRPPRNFMLALILALIVFLILISVRVFWDGMGTRHPPPVPLPQEETAPAAPAPSN